MFLSGILVPLYTRESVDFRLIQMVAVADLPLEAASAEATALSREERKLYAACIALIVIVAFPGKLLFYVSPGVLILMSLFTGGFVRFWRLIGILFGIVGLSLATIAFDVADGGHANMAGLVFGVITYLPIFILWSLSKDFRVSEGLAWRLANACLVFILVEATLGAVQWVITRDGDFVSGTFGLFDTVTNEVTISQVNFCFTLFCMSVYCAIWMHKRRMKLAGGVALTAALAAEAAHQNLFFMALIPALAVTGGRRLRRLTASIGIVCVVMVGAFFVDPEILEHIDGWAERVLLDPNSPKRLSVTGAVELMQGKNLLLGVGLGQFSSRAAILTAGSGTSVNLPKILLDTSTYYEQFMKLPAFNFQQSGEGSAIAMPYFSVLSVITEFGLVLTALLLFKIIQTVRENIRLGAVSREAWRVSCYCNFFIGFLFLCSFIQNYLELTQAIMIPVLLYIVSKARLRALADEVATSDARLLQGVTAARLALGRAGASRGP
jgi:hypothetical protein